MAETAKRRCPCCGQELPDEPDNILVVDRIADAASLIFKCINGEMFHKIHSPTSADPRKALIKILRDELRFNSSQIQKYLLGRGLELDNSSVRAAYLRANGLCAYDKAFQEKVSKLSQCAKQILQDSNNPNEKNNEQYGNTEN